MKMQSPRIFGIGGTIVDYVTAVPESYLVEHGFRKGGAFEVTLKEFDSLLADAPSSIQMESGGQVANTLRIFAQLGGHCAMGGRIGDDEVGDFFRKSLLNAGVRDELLPTVSYATGRCLSLVTPDGERTMRTVQGAFAKCTEADFAPEIVNAYDYVLVEGYGLYFPDNFFTYCQKMKQAGNKIIFDISSWELARKFQDKLDDFFQDVVDIALVNEEECAGLTPDGTVESGRRFLRDRCQIYVIKHGKNGSEIFVDGQEYMIPAYPIEDLSNTSGAGDVFAGGFLYGLLHGWTPEQSGRLGARLAAQVVQCSGALLSNEVVKDIKREFMMQL